MKYIPFIFIITWLPLASIEARSEPNLVPIGEGWAKNSVNTVIFRRNSVVTHENTQYVAYYAPDSSVMLARRTLGSEDWTVKKTQYTGNTRDAHNSISIMADRDGYLHMSWDHHGHPLRYCRSVEPGSLEMSDKMPMTGKKENKVTYPEFYRLPDGDLLFLYRDGGSGNGDLMINHYDTASQTWTQRQDALIDGEGERNAYWQTCIDGEGTIHLSWVWRETGDVATNHDIGYAKSSDGGFTWLKSNGEAYDLPIAIDNAEYAARVPQSHELINTTSMCADQQGRPYIATYWRPPGTEVPQYHLVYHDGDSWHTQQIGERSLAFSLSGGGTRRIPISRCQIMADSRSGVDRAYMLFRDRERGDRVSIAICDDLSTRQWRFEDLTDFGVGQWEPTYDTQQWKRDKQLHVFVQSVGQGEGETLEEIKPQMVSILEWTPE